MSMSSAAVATASGGMKIRVVSYNLLSSSLSSPTHFTSTCPSHLLPSNRLPLLLRSLSAELLDEDGAVVCLQEVSHEWASQLHTYFANREYHFVTGSYGRKFNGYMGLGIAYPLRTFRTERVAIQCLADFNAWPTPPPNSTAVTPWKDAFRSLRRTLLATLLPLLSTTTPTSRMMDPYEHSQSRNNVLLALILTHKTSNVTFCIGNYHMPCAFYAPIVMTIHSELAARYLQTLASSFHRTKQPSTTTDPPDTLPSDAVSHATDDNDNDEAVGMLPFVLAGDFNILPDSSQYKLLTTGQIDEEVDRPSYPPPKHSIPWKPTILPMRSAYSVKHGKEPTFTNYATTASFVKGGDNREEQTFVGTLDYIFLSSEWNVVRVKELITELEEGERSLPNGTEGSDHLLISADLTIESS